MVPTGNKGAFNPGWYYQPGLKEHLVPEAKNAETNAKLGYRSKVCSLVVVLVVQQKTVPPFHLDFIATSSGELTP